jgi:hypothetical protein
MKGIRTIGLVIALFLALAPGAQAGPIWAELMPAVANYHNLPGTAELPVGVGPLTTITGTIVSGTDFDLYDIFITDPAGFSASTVGTPGTLGDTQLFLFTSAGIGSMANDDSPTGGTVRSLLPTVASGLRPAGVGPTTPGNYFLGISGFDRDPTSAGGLIFPSAPFAGVFGPTGPGGGSPLSGQSGTSGTGTYSITLTGATFKPAGGEIPEPSSMVLLGLGLAGLAGIGYRRLKK